MLAETDPEERLFRKRKVTSHGRERTVYLLSLVELRSRSQIDPDSVIYTAIEMFGSDPFAVETETEPSDLSRSTPAEMSRSTPGGLSGLQPAPMSASHHHSDAGTASENSSLNDDLPTSKSHHQ